MYKNNFVLTVRVDGLSVGENINNGFANHDRTVRIPFDTEYELLLHNKNDRRAIVKIEIDGENVTGDGIVVDAHSSVPLKRPVHKDVAFKFVPVNSAQAKNEGKQSPQNGIVKATFYLEAKSDPVTPLYRPWYDYTPLAPQFDWNRVTCSSLNSSDASWVGRSSATPRSMMSDHVDATTYTAKSALGSAGCTVEGKATGQRFGTTSFISDSFGTTITLKLEGYAAPSQASTNDFLTTLINGTKTPSVKVTSATAHDPADTFLHDAILKPELDALRKKNADTEKRIAAIKHNKELNEQLKSERELAARLERELKELEGRK